MLFAIGTKVKFRYTDDEGEVRALLPEGMVSVYLPKDDMEIPAFPEDLIRMEEYLRHPVKAKVVEGKKPLEAPAPPPLQVEIQYTILKPLGIQLVFEAVETRQEVPEKYMVYLLNDTRYDVVYDIELTLNNRRPQNWNGKLRSVSVEGLGEFLYDDLNEAPEYDVECQWETTEGLSPVEHKMLKIKPKVFFTSLRTAPLLNRPVHWFRLFEKQGEASEMPSEDLETYTKRNAKPTIGRPPSPSSKHRHYSHVPDSAELAAFSPELDLHIDKLTPNWRKFSKRDILAEQLRHFDRYLSEAVRLGVPRVFIIHGVGEGKLKDAVATRLLQNPDVQTFKNEFHPRYGWGATEVVF